MRPTDLPPLSDLTAVILAGGLGTRLRPAVADRPKVLADVGGRPFLAYLLEQIAAAGVRRAVLCTGYKAEQVRCEFGTTYAAEYASIALHYSPELQPLGTGGAVALAAASLREVPAELLVMNGDSYCDTDLRGLYAVHAGCASAGTLILARVGDTSRFGRVTSRGGMVERFEEKGGPAGAGSINAGIYVLSRRLVESIPEGRQVSLEREVFPAWVGRGLHATAIGGRFIDIGTPQSYAEAEAFFGVPSAL